MSANRFGRCPPDLVHRFDCSLQTDPCICNLQPFESALLYLPLDPALMLLLCLQSLQQMLQLPQIRKLPTHSPAFIYHRRKSMTSPCRKGRDLRSLNNCAFTHYSVLFVSLRFHLVLLSLPLESKACHFRKSQRLYHTVLENFTCCLLAICNKPLGAKVSISRPSSGVGGRLRG